MLTDLVLAGNGPGELTGWVRPVARAARLLRGSDVRLTLVLSPTQFAGGHEDAVVRTWGLFDRVMTPSAGVRIALGIGRIDVGSRAAVLHLGGDLWFSSRIARRLRAPACAFAETALIARRHEAFDRVFAVSVDLAERLVKLGVPQDKVVVTGDPRVDVIEEATKTPSPSPAPSPQRGEGIEVGSHSGGGGRKTYVLSILPGSRDRFFRELVPYFLGAADALRTLHPQMEFKVICSSFLSPELVIESRREASRRWPGLQVEWVSGHPWPALKESHLALTIPGTNTVELAMAGVPYAAVVPMERLARVPAEGLLEWVGRIPGLGGLVKQAALTRYVARHPFLTLPNAKAGRMVAPEWAGRWTSMDLAKRLAEVLQDENRRVAMSRELRGLYGGATGAAQAIAASALDLATAEVRR